MLFLWTFFGYIESVSASMPRGTIDVMEEEVLPCSDKLAFDSEKEALDQARVIKWRHDTKLKAYKCRHCGLWHLSSNS